MARLLEPFQPERPQRLRIGQRLDALELAVGVDREARPASQDIEYRFDAPAVLGEPEAADLHLHHGVAGIEMAAHLVLEIGDGLPRPIPAAADITKHLAGQAAAAVAVGEHPVQRHIGDLRRRVPHRDLDGADPDRTLGVAADLLAPDHGRGDAGGIDVAAGLIEERGRVGPEDSRDEALAHLRAAGIAAGGVERKARDRLAAAHHAGNDGDDRRRHLRKVETRIGEVRFERNRDFADVDDAHAALAYRCHCPA